MPARLRPPAQLMSLDAEGVVDAGVACEELLFKERGLFDV
jgi:hypothetical protein